MIYNGKPLMIYNSFGIDDIRCFASMIYTPSAGEIHLRWMKSLRDEIPLRGER